MVLKQKTPLEHCSITITIRKDMIIELKDKDELVDSLLLLLINTILSIIEWEEEFSS